MPSRRGRPPADDLLTPAEWRVIEGVRHGMSNPQIARRRGVSLDAVKYHVANVMQKLGFDKREQLRAWAGVRKHSALGSTRGAPASTGWVLGPVGQVSRAVKDIGAATAWYRDVLGLKVLYTFGDLAFLDCAGLRLFLSETKGHAPESILYFSVTDIHAVQQTLTAKGVNFTSAPHLIHTHADGMEEWMTFFHDNEGRPLALMSQVRPAPVQGKETDR